MLRKKEKLTLKVKLRRWWKGYKQEMAFDGKIRATLKEFLPFGLYYRFQRLYWAIVHRTIKRFHVVNTGLRPGWYDLDTRMLHCSFELLRVWVEEEYDGVDSVLQKIEDTRESWNEDLKTGWNERTPENRYDYQQTIDAYEEALRLYKWWKEVYPRYEDENPYIKAFDELHPDKEHLWGFSEVASVDADGDPTSWRHRSENEPAELIARRHELVEQSMQYELKIIKEKTDNLVSLAKIREHLWT